MSTIILQLSTADVEVRGRKVKEGKSENKVVVFFSFNCRKTNRFSFVNPTVTMIGTLVIKFQQHALEGYNCHPMSE